MKRIAATIALLLVCAGTAVAAEQTKVTVDARETPIKDLVAQLSQQAGASIVLDPKAQGSVTLSLKDAELSQALDAVTKVTKLTYRKLQFAKPTDETIKLDEIKATMLALASMSMVGLSVEDPSAKTSSVFAKNLPSSPDTSGLKLPEGYSWATVYVILPADALTAKASDKPAAVSGDMKQRLVDLAGMTPEERKQYYQGEFAAEMSMAPEVRRLLLKDRMQAMFSLDQTAQQQYREDMRTIFHEIHQENPNAFPGGGPGGRRMNGGQGGQHTHTDAN